MFEKLKQEVKDVKRLNQIISVLAKNEIKNLRHGKKLSPESLKNILEELGGSFIKLGQLLSIRPDLIPLEYCTEMNKLQDKIKPIPLEKFNLKTKLKISKNVLGSASIAQVHTATLNNKKLVVKLIKPGIREQIFTDLEILKKIAIFISKNYKSKNFDPIQIYEEFELYTNKELNLNYELQNLLETRKYKHENKIIIPKPEEKYSNEDMLVMSYVPGKKISKKNKIKNSGNIIAREFWDQIFDHGFFHADPHPGNFLVSKKIGIIDWGIAGRLNEEKRNLLRKIFFGVILQNTDMIANSVLKLNSKHYPVDKEELKRDVQLGLTKYYNKQLEDFNATQLFNQILYLVRKHNIYLDKDYILFMKCIVTLEGTGLIYDKKFNFFNEAKSYVQKKLKKNIKEIAVDELKDFYHTLAFAKKLPEHASAFFEEELRQEQLLQGIQTEIKELNQDIKKVSKEMVLIFAITVLLIGSILLMDYTLNNIPVLSIIGFVLTTALILQLIHFIIK